MRSCVKCRTVVWSLTFETEDMSATCLRDWARSDAVCGSKRDRVRCLLFRHRSIKTPGAPVRSLYSRNHHVIIRLRLSPLSPGSLTARCQRGPVTNLMASSSSYSSVKRWRRMRLGGGPAAECQRSAWSRPQRGSRGAVWHPLPLIPVGRGGKSKRGKGRGKGGVSLKPCYHFTRKMRGERSSPSWKMNA